MTSQHQQGTVAKRIVSPSMANGASPTVRTRRGFLLLFFVYRIAGAGVGFGGKYCFILAFDVFRYILAAHPCS